MSETIPNQSISFYTVDTDFTIKKMFHGKGNAKAIYNQNTRTFGKQFNMMSSIGQIKTVNSKKSRLILLASIESVKRYFELKLN